jgi:anti-sigma regulatory factor (Ser/Thr protein kinase)
MQPRSDPGGETGGVDSDRLVVPNNLSELARVSEWVRHFAHEHRLERQLAYGLELSVNEALTNIMSYAYCDDARHEILVELFARPDRVHVEIEDDGMPFNPLDLPVEEPAKSLEKSRPTGRGILLMRNIMDELHYTRRDNRNALMMVMHYASI